MSKNNNVNPGQYKVAGRERMGENLDQEREKQRLTQNRPGAPGKRKAAKKR